MTYTFHGQQLPNELKESIDRYVQHGVPTGGFLQACIENDLRFACGRADEKHVVLLPVIVAYLVNRCPAGCWGRIGIFQEWIKWHIEKRATQLERDAHLGAVASE